MKNIFFLIVAVSFLTAFKSNSESNQILSNPTLELQQNKECINYENYVRKFITYLIKAPLSTASNGGIIVKTTPDFSHSAVLDKYSRKHLIHFQAISGKNKSAKRVAFTKEVTSNNSKVEVKISPSDIKEYRKRAFQVNLIVPNIDYSNVRHVKDIYLNPSNNKRYMKVVTFQGIESIHEIVLSEGSATGQNLDYIGWNYRCLE